MKRTIAIYFCLFFILPSLFADIRKDEWGETMQKEIFKLHQEINQLNERVRALEAREKAFSPDEQPFLDIPCMDEAYDTDTELRELGIAEGSTQQEAKETAIRQACESLAVKVYPEMISYYYVRTKDTREHRMENHITETQIQIVHSQCNIMCCNIRLKPTGVYEAFVAVSVSRGIRNL